MNRQLHSLAIFREMADGSIYPTAEECDYASCYCEENVWKLCQRLQEKGDPDYLHRASAVFISNTGRSVPLWSQKAGRGAEKVPMVFFFLIVMEDQVVVWDYHVILVYIGDDSTLIYDLDTTLPFPAPFNEYCEATFGSDDGLKECYHRKLRVVPAEKYLATFASDRRHMKKPDSEGGEWLQTPPPWPCIKTDAAVHNLDSFINMTDALGEGEVYDLGTFVSTFSGGTRGNLE